MISRALKPFIDPDLRPDFRLARILAERQECEGSCNRLAQRISEANRIHLPPGRSAKRAGAKQKDIVDRRKLTRIIEAHGKDDPGLNLTLRELYAIDVYLEQFNEGLAHKPIFDRPQLLQSLAEVREATFIIGCRPRDYRVDYSHWDINSMSEIQDRVGRIATGVQFHIRNVPLQSSVLDARKATAAPRLVELLGDEGPSIVCIGSPRANHAAEVMLAKMFEVEPFEDPSSHNGSIPFQFVWTPEPATSFTSCAATQSGPVARRKATASRDHVPDSDWAFRFRDEQYLARPVDKGQSGPRQTYGVVVTQRRKNGQFWMLVAGLSGAGTHAASLAVRDIADRLPYSRRRKEVSDVQWTVVEADVKLDDARPELGIPRITDHRIIDGPNMWSGRQS